MIFCAVQQHTAQERIRPWAIQVVGLAGGPIPLQAVANQFAVLCGRFVQEGGQPIFNVEQVIPLFPGLPQNGGTLPASASLLPLLLLPLLLRQ